MVQSVKIVPLKPKIIKNRHNSNRTDSQSSGYLFLKKSTTESPYLSLVMRKPAFCICGKKDADQLLGNREADQRLCFRHTDSTIPVLHIYEISSLYPSCVVVQPGYCQTWSETPKTCFLTTRLKYNLYIHSEGKNVTETDIKTSNRELQYIT